MSLPDSFDDASSVFDVVIVRLGVEVMLCSYVLMWDVSGNIMPRA